VVENPFVEPGHNDRTVIGPTPGGVRRPARKPGPPAGSRAAAPGASETSRQRVPADGPDLSSLAAGAGHPLALAAAPLLHLLSRLRNTATAPDPGDMRARTLQELRAFEDRAKRAGVPVDQVRVAHYALCAALDDVVLSTPWGSEGRWNNEPLAVALHNDPRADAGFFDALRSLRTRLPASAPVIELMFVCLSLGMMGPYRTAPNGLAQLERIRHQVFSLLQQPPAPPLSATAHGVDAPRRRRWRVPIWVLASATLAALAVLYIWCLNSLNETSDALYRQASNAPPTSMPLLIRPPATPPPPRVATPPQQASNTVAERLRQVLAGLPGVEVILDPSATVVRIPAQLLFPAPNATLSTAPAIEQLSEALRSAPVTIRVVAHLDSEPLRNVAFPSKFALTQARANAVKSALARRLPDASQIGAEGRADAEPLESNATADGRKRNRRIEIIVQSPQ
jgi:type VI secretion system protein ImpK